MKTIKLGINVSNFIDSYRNIGYTCETAIADIIDNSIFAKATRIDINMIWDDFENDSPCVQIIDNGLGMHNDELVESMRLACKSPSDYRDPSDLGRFGLGLKSASFSQCNLLTVGSKKEGYGPCCKQWDVSFIRESNDFLLNDCTLEESGVANLIPSEHGTVVLWSQLDNLNIPSDASAEKKHEYWKQLEKRVCNHISMTFGSFVNKISFFFNSNPIELWDPFLKDNPGTNVLTEESIFFADGKEVKISSYIIPSMLSETEMEKLTKNKCLNDLQGFYVYRNNRLIIAGSWLGLKDIVKKEAYRLAHIRLDIDNSMDSLWHIDIKKEVAICPPELQDKLVSYARHARTASAAAFRARKKHVKAKFTLDDKKAYIWSSGTKQGKPFYEINRRNPVIETFANDLSNEQRKVFMNLLKYVENYIPVMAIIETESTSNDGYVVNNASEIKDEDILESFKKAVDIYVDKTGDYDFSVKTCALTEPFVSHLEVIEPYLKENGIELKI